MAHSRRDFLRKGTLLALSGTALPLLGNAMYQFNPADPTSAILPGNEAPGEFTLPQLPYAYDALEPNIDKLTMEIHHTKHHQAYINNLNKAVKEGNIAIDSLETLLNNVSKYPAAIRNNGGGHWNHSFFWKLMKPGGGGTPTGKVAEAINQAFGSFEEFKKQINETGVKRFGSGWAWLIRTNEGKLAIGSTPNQDNPLMDVSELKGKPILGVDVWEHAYYLKYQNKRGDYLNNWWNVINWDQVATAL
jgi:Fe-Mn family superoxide dismutase